MGRRESVARQPDLGDKIGNIGIFSQVAEPLQSIHNMFPWSLLYSLPGVLSAVAE